MDLDILNSRLKELEDSKKNLENEYYKLLGRISEVLFLIEQAQVQDVVNKGEPVDGDNI